MKRTIPYLALLVLVIVVAGGVVAIQAGSLQVGSAAGFAIDVAAEEFPLFLRLEGTRICPNPTVHMGVSGFGLVPVTVVESTDTLIRVSLPGEDVSPYTAAVVVDCPRQSVRLYATIGLAGFGS